MLNTVREFTRKPVVQKVAKIVLQVFLTLGSGYLLYHLLISNIGILSTIQFQSIPKLLLITFPLYAFSAILSGIVWGKMMGSVGASLPIKTHLTIYIATLFAGRLPGGIWHIVGRASWYERYGISKRITIFASALQLLIVLLSGLLVSVILFPFLFSGLGSNYYLVILLAVVILIGLLNPRMIRAFLTKFARVEIVQSISYVHLLAWIGLYLINWLCGGTILFLIIRTLYLPSAGLNLWLSSIGGWSIGGTLGSMVTFLPSGLGITEASLSLALSTTIPASVAVISAVVLRIILTLYEFVFSAAFYFLSMSVFSKEKHHEGSA
jgi:hypothetical protein